MIRPVPRLLAAALLIVPILVAGCREASAPTPPPVDELAIIATRGGEMDIFRAATDGSAEVRITRGGIGYTVNVYDWAPGGARLSMLRADAGEVNLWVIDADGSNMRQLTESPQWETGHAWSPDGTRIAFSRGNGLAGGSDIVVVNVATGVETNLTNSTIPNAQNQFGSWSPDGARIAFTANRREDPQSVEYSVYVMNADGSGVTRLAQGTGALWSPDGSRILFMRGEQPAVDQYVMHADGSNVINLSQSEGTADGWGRWSPDGRRIVFQRRPPEMITADLWLVERDGSGLARLTNHPGIDFDAAWSPDGTLIAFTRQHGTDRNVMLIAPDGTGLRALVAEDGFNWLQSTRGAWRPR